MSRLGSLIRRWWASRWLPWCPWWVWALYAVFWLGYFVNRLVGIVVRDGGSQIWFDVAGAFVAGGGVLVSSHVAWQGRNDARAPRDL